MDWRHWHKDYEQHASLQARLERVRVQIVAALSEFPPGPVRIVSLCAGDGRDLIGALESHPRRADITARLIDNDPESIARGRQMAATAGLSRQLQFVEADATLAKNYDGAVPANLVLLSGFLGHLPHDDVPGLIRRLPMFCQAGGQVIWNRHLVLHDGHRQVTDIRKFLAAAAFAEVHYATTDANGFAVGRARFNGSPVPLDTAAVLFTFVGLDKLLFAEKKSGTEKFFANAASVRPENKNPLAQAAETSVPARFRQLVAAHPARIALSGGSWQATYADLDTATNRLAHMLLAQGGNQGDRVALLLRHDAPLVAGALAGLKAGRIIVVLNPTDPPARLKEMLDDADPGVILTDAANENLARQIANANQSILTFAPSDTGAATAPEIAIRPTDIAWLIYTSGSSGRPKGVIQTHRNIVHNVLRLTEATEISPADRLVLLGSPSGGQGVSTLWCALLNGAALHPFPLAERGAAALREWLRKHQITVYVSSTSVFRSLVKTCDDGDRFPEMRLVRFGSESATADDFASYQKFFSDRCVLINSLSSSETGNITHQRFQRSDSFTGGRLPVGWPANGMEVLLVDENGGPAGAGDTGEILVRSAYLSPGYWRNDLLTAERFLPDAGGGRVFRSGDLGRQLSDGSLLFADRKDARIKIHGYRVELSEIEDALRQQPAVQDVFVSGRRLPDGDSQLLAHIIPRAGQPSTVDGLRQALRQRLPAYMVPAHFIFLENFPLTPHGKIDHAALPPPPETKKNLRRHERPRDIVEARLAKIWETALGISPVGRQDDFFDLGGSSLPSVEVLLHIEEAFGVVLPPSILTEYSTVEKLAAVLAGHVVLPSPSPLVVLQAADSGRPFFLVHTGQGDVTTYGPLARRLKNRPIYGLQSVGLHGESWPLMSVPAMARRYLAEIISKDPTGPYLLGATCMGGMVIFEMAHLLRQQGREVALLALMDVRHPMKSWQHPKWRERLLGTLRDPIRDGLRRLRWAIGRATGRTRGDRWLPDYRRFVAHMNSRADRAYTPKFYPGAATLFVTVDTKFPGADPRLPMRRHLQTSEVVTLPGLRSGLFVPPVVDQLARQLELALARAEQKILREPPGQPHN
jgi:amino acid adenylation domain-containing protein